MKRGHTMSNTIKQRLAQAEKALGRQDYEQAGALFEAIVTEQPEAHRAWFGLGEVALGIGQLDTAVPFLEHAVQLAPDTVPYLQRLGELYGRIGLIREGVEVLVQARRRAPKDLGVLASLSGAYVKAGDWHKARAVLKDLAALPGAGAGHWCLLGLACQELGELDAALAALKKATVLAPKYADAWLSLGHLYLQRKLLPDTERCLKKLFELAPNQVPTLGLAGEVALLHCNFREAADFYRAAARLAPGDALLQAKLALALVQSGDAKAAVDAMTRAHEMGLPEDWILENLGFLFTTRGQLDAARENLEMAVERQPGNLNAWNTLIVVYGKLGLLEKARQAAEKILEQDPHHANALVNLGGWYSDQARNEEALACYKRALAADPEGGGKVYTNLLWALVHSTETTVTDILDIARDFDRKLCLPLLRQDDFADRDRNPARRLRIGWLTSDMRSHPVATFVLPFIRELDGALVENFFYYNSRAADSVTEMAKSMADCWREVIGLGDEALAKLIRADEIDILIDLNGNTEGHRLLAVARKPAPIQATWLGYPGTSGMTAMDYILIPPDPVLEKGDWCTETPWPLPDCYGVRAIPDRPVLPGLPCERLQRPFTFACLNGFRKVSQGAIRLWSRILLAAPDTRLLLIARGGNDGTMIEYVHGQFARHGIVPQRLEIMGMVGTNAYFDTYNEVDLCFDPFPFNGGTTGYDSIWMGVPFITWPGDMLVSRMGKPILENVGLAELVVESEDAYVDLAVALANDRERLKRLRANLRERMQASPLLDAPRMARNLEKAFREMWQKWCAQRGEERAG